MSTAARLIASSLVVVCAIVVLGVVESASALQDEKTPAAPYVSKEFGFTISPGSYSTPEFAERFVALRLKGEEEKRYTPTCEVAIHFGKFKAVVYEDILIDWVAENKLKLVSSEVTKTGEYNSVDIEFKGSIDGNSQYFIGRAIVTDDRVFFVTAACLQKHLKKSREEMQAVVDSFKPSAEEPKSEEDGGDMPAKPGSGDEKKEGEKKESDTEK